MLTCNGLPQLKEGRVELAFGRCYFVITYLPKCIFKEMQIDMPGKNENE